VDDLSAARKARNEALARAANEDIKATRDSLPHVSGPTPFICECEDPQCGTVVQLGPLEYEHVRSNPRWFLVASGHLSSQGQTVSEHEGYSIVEKHGVAGAVADRENPREPGALKDDRKRRIGENEVLFRQVNERLEDLNDTFGSMTGEAAYVCECGNSACIEQITLTLAEYERIRSDPTLFAIVPGHELPDVEEVVEQNPEYHIVRKQPGGPAELAVAHDPRA
jgi:hypothetical protein